MASAALLATGMVAASPVVTRQLQPLVRSIESRLVDVVSGVEAIPYNLFEDILNIPGNELDAFNQLGVSLMAGGTWWVASATTWGEDLGLVEQWEDAQGYVPIDWSDPDLLFSPACSAAADAVTNGFDPSQFAVDLSQLFGAARWTSLNYWLGTAPTAGHRITGRGAEPVLTRLRRQGRRGAGRRGGCRSGYRDRAESRPVLWFRDELSNWLDNGARY